MNKEEILEKAISKAMDAGWDSRGMPADSWESLSDLDRRIIIEKIYLSEDAPGYFIFIYDHDFAKALWPKKGINQILIKGLVFPFTHDWEKHLMQMVISDDPIKYLGENI